jgi:hypothetical protein
MSKRSWQFTMVVLAGGLGLVPSFARADEPNPRIGIRIEDRNGRCAASLARAQSIAGNIYRQAGVTLQWAMDEAPTAHRRLTVIIITSATAPAGLALDAMGVAPTPGDGSRGTTAFVFSDRVAAFASAYRLAESDVLASALAHEIGHLLLPPNAHTAHGIMRASWRPAFFPPAAPGIAGFPPEQARLLRLRALSR